MYLKSQGISDATNAIEEYENQISDLKGQFDQTSASISTITFEQQTTRDQLAMGLLQNIGENHVDSVAKEIGALHIPTKLKELHQVHANNLKTLESTKASTVYQKREELIDPVFGTMTRDLEENRRALDGISKKITKIEKAPHFRWIKKDQEEVNGILSNIRRFITLDFLYRNRRYKKFENSVGPVNSALSEYVEDLTLKSELEANIQNIELKMKPVLQAIETVERLSTETDRFEMYTLQTLRSLASEHLENINYKQLVSTVRGDATVLIAKLDALESKLKHLVDIQQHIKSEISDREKRMDKVQLVLRKWVRSKKVYLSSDKSKWLVDTPAGSRKRTNRFVSSYSSNRMTIENYSDYTTYNLAFCTGLNFATLPIFAAGTSMDSYTVSQIFSENDLMEELVESGETLLEGDMLEEVMSADEFGLDESSFDTTENVDVLDEMDAS